MTPDIEAVLAKLSPEDAALVRGYVADLEATQAQIIEQMGEMEADAERLSLSVARRGRQVRQLRARSTSSPSSR